MFFYDILQPKFIFIKTEPCGWNFSMYEPHEPQNVFYNVLTNYHWEEKFVEHHSAKVFICKLVF